MIGLASEVPINGLEKVPLMKDYTPGLNLYGCWNLILPKGTPKEIQDWYRANFIPAINSKEAKEKFDENMMIISTSEHTAQGLNASMTKLRKEWQPIAQRFKLE